tara:strand:- start:140 stop:364 length:225 start_codon:yes stop_codon:yes gene_type:complete
VDTEVLVVVAARDGIMSPEAAAAVDIVAVKEVTPMVIQLAVAADQRTPDQTKPIPQTLVAVTVRLSLRIYPVHP